MLSPFPIQCAATRFFEFKTASGYDMSAWRVLRSHPATLSPSQLVLLAEHTNEDIGTLISHGIGVANRLDDLLGHIIIDRRGIRSRQAADLAA